MTDDVAGPADPIANQGDGDMARPMKRYRVLLPLSPRQGALIPIGGVHRAAYDPDVEARMIAIGALRPMADDEPDELPKPEPVPAAGAIESVVNNPVDEWPALADDRSE